MGFFRNPEVKRGMILYAGITGAACVAGFAAGGVCGYIVLVVCLVFDCASLLRARRRYSLFAQLCEDIDRTLHGKDDVNFAMYSEGELAILQDEIFKMTRQLREKTDALQRDKLSLADSLADISHQIRTPLTSINLILSILSQPALTDERRMELTGELTNLLTQIDWLISALLKISRLDADVVSFKREPVSVLRVIESAASPLWIPLELRDQRLKITMAGNESFLGDPGWSAEALGNILKNCMEHTGAGGLIETEAQENSLYTQIVVKDNGQGISKEDLPHLFERFYSGRKAGRQSVGIGLALARMIIKAQNGTVKAENRPGGGAMFTIRFYKRTV